MIIELSKKDELIFSYLKIFSCKSVCHLTCVENLKKVHALFFMQMLITKNEIIR